MHLRKNSARKLRPVQMIKLEDDITDLENQILNMEYDKDGQSLIHEMQDLKETTGLLGKDKEWDKTQRIKMTKMKLK